MFATLLVAGCVLFGQAESPPGRSDSPDELAPVVRRLVRDLDAPEKARREQAEQELLELGIPILELLPETDDRTAAEVALRLERVRSQLERASAEASVAASTVTLSGEMPLSEVLAAIEKQTGNKLVDFRQEFNQEVPDPKLKVQFEKVPFWQALDQVMDQAGLTIYNYAAENGLALVAASETQLPRSGRANYQGAFRIEATEFTAHRDLRDPQSHTLQLVLEVAWEPRLSPIVIMQPADAVQATGEGGQAVATAGRGNELEIPVDPGVASADLPLQFELPERGLQRIASLKGKLMVVLPGRTETFRFEKLEQARREQRQKAGVTVVLDEMRKNNEAWEARVRVVFDKTSGALESHRGWVFNNEAWLEDPAGERVDYGLLETTRQTENEVGVAYLFDLPGSPKGHTLIYKTPAAIVAMPLEYELTDLELP